MSTANPGTVPTAIPAGGEPRAESTSSVQKACRILRAMSDTKNARLTDIAREAGLDKATTLRLLDVLTRDGFVNRDPSTKHYSLGTEVFVLGPPRRRGSIRGRSSAQACCDWRTRSKTRRCSQCRAARSRSASRCKRARTRFARTTSKLGAAVRWA
jgi:hypothetical protein